MKIGTRLITETHGDKVLFPEDGITKADLMEYYRRVAPRMYPLLKDRVLTLQRFPDGIRGKDFIQREAPEYFPSWVKRVRVPVERGTSLHVACANEATIPYLASQGVITPHLWLSRADKLDIPDRLIFDLDPSGDDFTYVREAAFALKHLLERNGLHPFAMTTGSRGLHVTVPIRRELGFDEVRACARSIAGSLVEMLPREVSVEERKSKRRGRLYLDIMRNAYAASAVAPYAVRARIGAPVAMPIDWAELEAPDFHARWYTVKRVLSELGTQPDPWAQFGQSAVSLKGFCRDLPAA